MLNFATRRNADSKLKDIAWELKKPNYLKGRDLGVLDGIAGIAVFLFHYYKYTNDEIFSELGAKYIDEIIARINEGYSYPTYCNGLAGAAWAIEYLQINEFITFDSDINLPNLDSYLYKNMVSTLEREEFDFLHAGIGYGYYFLQRYNVTQQKVLKLQYLKYIEELIVQLFNFAKFDNDGVYWTDKARECPNTIDLGLSHGMASIVSFLSKVRASQIENEKAEMLLKLSVNFIMNSQLSNSIATFPLTVNSQTVQGFSRLAWCHGDLGIATSLVHAAPFISENKLFSDAVRIVYKSCKRKSGEETGVVDAGLCHGAIGLAVIYHNFYSMTGNYQFKQTCNFWIDDCLSRASFSDGLAGFKKYNDNGYVREANLLDGIAGIGLGLITVLSTDRLLWETCLMIK